MINERVVFRTSSDFSALLDGASLDLEEWSRERQRIPRASTYAHEIEAMMRQPGATIRALQSENVELRLCAVRLINDYWLGDQRLVADVLRAAFEDPCPTVRGGAIQALPLLKEHIVDPEGVLSRLLLALFEWPSKQVRNERSRALYRDLERGRREWSKKWQALAGARLGDILKSRDSAASYLRDHDSSLRQAALFALKHYWRPDKDFERLCEELLCNDPDVAVRAAALSCLSGCLRQTDDARVGRLVADLVVDPNQAIRLRRAAYVALFQIRGMPPQKLAEAASRELRIPDDVDWEFVNSFRGVKKGIN